MMLAEHRAPTPRKTKTLSERFWAMVDKSEDGCWTWTGVRRRKGYGGFSVRDGERWRMRQAHRVSWELHNGPIPNGLLVCHKCDNPPCVRPDHLFLGTNSDNMQDAISKGRFFTNPQNQFKTHCPRGHEYTPENTDAPRVGERACRTCKIDLQRERRSAPASGKPSHGHEVADLGDGRFVVSWIHRERRNHKTVDRATAERFIRRWAIRKGE